MVILRDTAGRHHQWHQVGSRGNLLQRASSALRARETTGVIVVLEGEDLPRGADLCSPLLVSSSTRLRRTIPGPPDRGRVSSRKTTGVTLDLVPVAITAIGNQRTTCFPQIAHYTPAYVAAHRRTAVGNQRTTCFPQNCTLHTCLRRRTPRTAIGNQRTTCFPQIAHYTPAFVAAPRTAIGNQRTTCFPQIAHYAPAFVAAHRRRSCLLYTSPSPRDATLSRMPSSA